MARLTKQEVINVCRSVGFPESTVALAASIAWAESEGKTDARFTNGPGSIDRGLFQINSHYHPHVSDACADNPGCAASYARQLSKNGTDWTPWTTYTNERYKRFLPEMQRLTGTPSTPGGGGAVPSGNYVVLYDQPGFRGNREIVKGDVPDARFLTGYKRFQPDPTKPQHWNGYVKSIAIPPGVVLTIFSSVYYNKGGDGNAPIMLIDRSQPELTLFNKGRDYMPPSSWAFGDQSKRGPGKVEDRRGKGVLGIPGGGLSGGDRPFVTASGGFLRIAQQIAAAEHISNSPEPNTTVDISLGTIDLSVIGGSPVTIGGSYEVPGTGYLMTAAKNAPAVFVRAAIVGVGLYLFVQGVK